MTEIRYVTPYTPDDPPPDMPIEWVRKFEPSEFTIMARHVVPLGEQRTCSVCGHKYQYVSHHTAKTQVWVFECPLGHPKNDD